MNPLEKSELIESLEPMEKSKLIEMPKSELISFESKEAFELIEKPKTSEIIISNRILRNNKRNEKRMWKIKSFALCFVCGESNHIRKDCLKGKSELKEKSKLIENAEFVVNLELSKSIEDSKLVDKSESLETLKLIVNSEFVDKSEPPDSFTLTEKSDPVVPEMTSKLRRKRRQTKKIWQSHVCFICHEPNHTKKHCPKKDADTSNECQHSSVAETDAGSTGADKSKHPETPEFTNLYSGLTEQVIVDQFPSLYAGLKRAQEIQQIFMPFAAEINFKVNNSSALDTAAKRRRLMSKLSETTISSTLKSNSSDLKKGQISIYSTTTPSNNLNALGEMRKRKREDDPNSPVIGKNIEAKNSRARNDTRDQSEHVHYVSLKPNKLFSVYDPFEHELKKMSWRQKHPPYGYIFNINYSVSYESTGHIIYSTKQLLEEVSNCKIQFIPEDGSEKRHFKLTGTRPIIEKVKKLIERSIEKSHVITGEKYMDVIVPGPPGRRAIEMLIPGNKVSRLTGENGFVLNNLMKQADVSMALHPEGVHTEAVARTLQIIGLPPMCIQAQQLIEDLMQEKENLSLNNKQAVNVMIDGSEMNKISVNIQLPLKKDDEQQSILSVPANKSVPLNEQSFRDFLPTTKYINMFGNQENLPKVIESSSVTIDPWVNQNSKKNYMLTTISDFVHPDSRASLSQQDNGVSIHQQDDRDSSRYRNERNSSRQRDDRDSSRYRNERNSSRQRDDKDAYRQRNNRDSTKNRDDRDSYRRRDNKDSTRHRDDRDSFRKRENKDSCQQKDNSLSFEKQDNRSTFRCPDNQRDDLAYLNNKIDSGQVNNQAGFRHNAASIAQSDKTTNFRLVGSEQLDNRVDPKYPDEATVSERIADKFPQSLPQNKTAQLLQYYISLIKQKAVSNLQNQSPVSAEANPMPQHVFSTQFAQSSPTQLPALQNNLQPPIGQYHCIVPGQDYQPHTESGQLLPEEQNP